VTEGYTRNQMVNKFHLELTGEKISVSRRRLKQLQRDAKNETKATQLEEKIAKFASQSKSGLEFLTFESQGYAPETEDSPGFRYVDTLEAFESVQKYWAEQEQVGFNALFNGPKISLISLATEDRVHVFDIYVLYKDESVLAFF